mgnify:CR=1 FL=1
MHVSQRGAVDAVAVALLALKADLLDEVSAEKEEEEAERAKSKPRKPETESASAKRRRDRVRDKIKQQMVDVRESRFARANQHRAWIAMNECRVC